MTFLFFENQIETPHSSTLNVWNRFKTKYGFELTYPNLLDVTRTYHIHSSKLWYNTWVVLAKANKREVLVYEKMHDKKGFRKTKFCTMYPWAQIYFLLWKGDQKFFVHFGLCWHQVLNVFIDCSQCVHTLLLMCSHHIP
jgi:hypothetical protein